MSIILKPKYLIRKPPSPSSSPTTKTTKKHIREMLEMVTVTLQQQSLLDERLTVLKRRSYMDRLKLGSLFNKTKQNSLDSCLETNRKVRIRRLSIRASPLAFYQDKQPSGICENNQELKILSYPLSSRNISPTENSNSTLERFDDYKELIKQPHQTKTVLADRTIQTQGNRLTLDSEKLPEVKLTRVSGKASRNGQSCKVRNKRQTLFNFVGKMTNGIQQEFTDEHILKVIEPNKQNSLAKKGLSQLPILKSFKQKYTIPQSRCLENIQPEN